MVAAFRGCPVAVPIGAEVPPGGGPVSVSISPASGCFLDLHAANRHRLAHGAGRQVRVRRSGPLTLMAAPLPQGVTFRQSEFRIDALYVIVTQRAFEAADDDDADGLRDTWERQFGLDDESATGDDGPSGDPDSDGRTNAQEQQAGTHPRGFFKALPR